VVFRNTKLDGLTVSNSSSFSTAFPSILHNSTFLATRQNAVKLYNTKNGWDVRFGTFTNNRTGIHMLNTFNNSVLRSTFNFNLSDRAFASNMNFIHMSSCANNLIGRDTENTNYFSITSEAQPAD